MNVLANRNSFHAWMNVRIAVVNTPGAASGTMTLRNACSVVAPSTFAASSRSAGNSLKKATRIQIVNGSAKTTSGMIMAQYVFMIPTAVNWMNNGAMIATAGKKLIARINVIIGLLKRKRSLAIEYAQMEPKNRQITVVVPATITLFTSACMKSGLPKTVL